MTKHRKLSNTITQPISVISHIIGENGIHQIVNLFRKRNLGALLRTI